MPALLSRGERLVWPGRSRFDVAALGLGFHVRYAKGRSKPAQVFRHTLRLRWVVVVVVGRQIHVSGAVGGALGDGRSCVLFDPVGALVWSARCPAVYA